MEPENRHKHDNAPAASEEDATLDIVRLLVETETRLAGGPAGVAKPQTAEHQATAVIAPDPEAAAPAVTPRRGLRKPVAPQAEPEAAQPELPDVEDLRPGGLIRVPRMRMPKLAQRFSRPRLKLPSFFKRRTQEPRVEASQAQVAEKQDWKQYAKLAGLVGIAIVIVFKPWLIPLVIFGLIWLSLIVFLLMGSSRVSEVAESVWAYYQSKRPERAGRILSALQRAADRLDGMLARLPERWVDNIYTPDLGRSERDMDAAEAYELGADPFDRLQASHGPAE